MLKQTETENRIVEAMRNGATLVFHMRGYLSWGELTQWCDRVTLQAASGQELTLTSKYREDEYYYAPDSEDGSCWLRHGNYARMPDCGERFADGLIKRDDVRKEYAGYRGDHDRQWREIYVHVNRPVPRWVSEQWDDPFTPNHLPEFAEEPEPA